MSKVYRLIRVATAVIVSGIVAAAAPGCGDSHSKCSSICVDADRPTPSGDGPVETSAPAPDGGDLADIPTDTPEIVDAACPADGFFGCAVSSIGNVCNDEAVSAVCEGGAWQCPGGGTPLSQCKCIGALPPGCACTDQGIRCVIDGGSDADAQADAGG